MKLKSLISYMLLVMSQISFGQTSVPNTNTFSLQDVYTVIGSYTSTTTTQDLQNCIINSVDSYFDPNYKGSKNSLYNFRNYTIPIITKSLYYGITTSNCMNGDFSSSLSLTCQALSDMLNTNCVGVGGGAKGFYGASYIIGGGSLVIGAPIYE